MHLTPIWFGDLGDLQMLTAWDNSRFDPMIVMTCEVGSGYNRVCVCGIGATNLWEVNMSISQIC